MTLSQSPFTGVQPILNKCKHCEQTKHWSIWLAVLFSPQQTPYWYFLVNFCRKISSTFTSYTHLSSSIVLICFSPSKLTTSAVVYFAALFATLIRASTSRLFSIYKDGFKVLQILKRTLVAFMVKNDIAKQTLKYYGDHRYTCCLWLKYCYLP